MKNINVKNKKIYEYDGKTTEYNTDHFLTEAAIHGRIMAALNQLESLKSAVESMKAILKEIEKKDEK